MDFPIDAFLDEQACYDQLVALLHPQGLSCPNGHELASLHAGLGGAGAA